MITPKKLMAMARKWQKFASNKRQRISFPRKRNEGQSSSVANEGHFVVYTNDKRRFEFPLEYLSSNFFVELFNMSEEVFGLPTEGPITLPCDSISLNYVIQLVNGQVSEQVQKAVLTCISSCYYSSSSSSDFLQQSYHQIPIFSF